MQARSGVFATPVALQDRVTAGSAPSRLIASRIIGWPVPGSVHPARCPALPSAFPASTAPPRNARPLLGRGRHCAPAQQHFGLRVLAQLVIDPPRLSRMAGITGGKRERALSTRRLPHSAGYGWLAYIPAHSGSRHDRILREDAAQIVFHRP